MKNDLPYFSHDNDARNHPKMKALRARFGWAGYGQFWALNEMIAHAPNARLDLSKKITRLATADDLGLSLDTFEEFLSFIADPEIDLVNYAEGILTTDRTQDDYTIVEAERLRKRGLGKVSAEHRSISAEERKNSAEESNRAEQSRAEERIEEQQRARELSTSELQGFGAWALEEAKRAGAKTPRAYARSIIADPKRLEDWRQSLVPPPPPRPEDTPPTCLDCGRAARIITTGPGEAPQAQCIEHGRSWTFDTDWADWIEDPRPAEYRNTG